jgi:hypothetical protein
MKTGVSPRLLLAWTALAWASVVAPLSAAETATATVWRVNDVARVGGHATEVIGAPRVAEGAVVFDGKQDGLLVPDLPLAGARAWTVEVLFNPAEGGGEAQRFVHLEDTQGRRALIETRLNGRGGWWLDTHVRMGDTDRGLTLIDPQRVHATDRWYWAALSYDGKTLTHYVNGAKELEGAVAFGPMGQGKISLGVRQNRVYWFKGAIREVRFTRAALGAGQLQRGN